VLGALALACVLSLVTFGTAIYAIRAKDPRKGLRAGWVATVIATVAIALSFPIWSVALSGKDTHGEKLTADGAGPIYGIVAVESFFFVMALTGLLRQRARAI
jgi:hypothetical protein